MTAVEMAPFPKPSEEELFTSALAAGDAAQNSLAPILRHLVANDGNSLLNDEIVARFRGMAADVARRLLVCQAQADEAEDVQAYVETRQERLIQSLLSDVGLIRHIHALAMEGQIGERLAEENAIEPVLTPLMQALIGSSEPDTAGIAMAALAAQARFLQSQRRMELPIGELPGDLFHMALVALGNCAQDAEAVASERAVETLREHFDESFSRIGLLSRLITGMGAGAIAALNVEHSGLALFLTGLAIAANEPREVAAVSLGANQAARLALSLRAAGLEESAVLAQMLILAPDGSPPGGIEHIGAEQASWLLSAATGS